MAVCAGAVYDRSGFKIKITREYPIDDTFNPIEKDPINLSYADNSMNLTVAGKVRIGIIILNTSFAFQKYPVANLGVGVMVR